MSLINMLKNNKKFSFLIFIIAMCMFVLCMAFFLTLCGVINLKFVAEAQLPLVIEIIINAILFNIQTFFMIAICTSYGIKKSAIFTLIYIPVSIVCSFISQGLFIDFITLIYILLLFIFEKKRTKKQWIRECIIFISLYITMVGISALLGFVKLTNFADVMNIQNSLIGFITSIDLYIVSIFVILIKKEVQHNEMEFLVSTEKQGICKTDRLCKETVTTQSAVEKDKLDLSGLNRRQKLIFYILATGYQFLQLGAVLAIGFIGNAIFELIAMLATFWLGRRILKKCWHSEKLSICSFVTIASFYVLTRITLPFSISLFCCIILSSAFTYGLYLLAIHFETIENLKGTCLTKGQAEIDLRNKCFDKGLDETETKMCVDYFIHRLSHKEIAVKYGIELQTSLNKKLRFKKKLEGK